MEHCFHRVSVWEAVDMLANDSTFAHSCAFFRVDRTEILKCPDGSEVSGATHVLPQQASAWKLPELSLNATVNDTTPFPCSHQPLEENQ